MFLDRYSITATPVVASEGTAFTQKLKGKKDSTGNSDSRKKDFDN
jgi:hypothetical protein